MEGRGGGGVDEQSGEKKKGGGGGWGGSWAGGRGGRERWESCLTEKHLSSASFRSLHAPKNFPYGFLSWHAISSLASFHHNREEQNRTEQAMRVWCEDTMEGEDEQMAWGKQEGKHPKKVGKKKTRHVRWNYSLRLRL